MKSFAILMVSAGALALASCGHKNDGAEQNTSTMTTTAVNDTVPASAPVSGGQAFANTAAASDAFEIATSKLAIDKAHSRAVKAFAKQMIAAHTDSTAKLKTAASAAAPAIVPDPALTPEQQQTLDTLGGLNGTDFDTAYIAGQTDGHTKTLGALKDYAGSGDVPQLKDFAAKMVPIVTAHLNMAKGLKP